MFYIVYDSSVVILDKDKEYLKTAPLLEIGIKLGEWHKRMQESGILIPLSRIQEFKEKLLNLRNEKDV